MRHAHALRQKAEFFQMSDQAIAVAPPTYCGLRARFGQMRLQRDVVLLC